MCTQKTRLLEKAPENAHEHNSRNAGKTVRRQSMCTSVKVKLTVYIPASLYEKLLDYIMLVHGGDRPHGALSHTVNELLDWALNSPRRQAQAIVATRCRSRTFRKCEQIVSYMMNELGMKPGSIFSYALLKRVIATVAGGDKRTIKKYVEFLKRFGFIKEHPRGFVLL